MDKINTDILFKQDTCYFQNQPKKGKVLAVSTSHTHRRVCFRIEGEEWGTWVNEDALFGESNNYVRKTLELSDKIVDKATKDLNNVIEAGNKLNTVKNKYTVKNVVCTDIQINNRLTVILKGSIKVIKFIKSVVNELWNRYWKDRIVNSLKNRDFSISNSRKIVTDLKRDFPSQNNYKIAEKLITEKAIFATITGLIKEIPGVKIVASIPVVNRRVEFLNVQGLITELVDQIAFVYGYEQVSESEKLGILAIVFDKSILLNIGLSSLIESKVPNWEINAISTISLFTILGYATREFYESKNRLNRNPLDLETEFMSIKYQAEKDSMSIANQKDKFEKLLQSKLTNSEKQIVQN